MEWENLLKLSPAVAAVAWLVVALRRWDEERRIPKAERPPRPSFPWIRFWGVFALYMLSAVLIAGVLIAVEGPPE